MKIISSHDFNGHHYVTVSDDLLGRVELKCSDAEVVGHIERLRALREQEEVEVVVSADARSLTNKELLAEVKRRNIDVMVRGVAR